jgi:opacity protein-like surface antigen
MTPFTLFAAGLLSLSTTSTGEVKPPAEVPRSLTETLEAEELRESTQDMDDDDDFSRRNEKRTYVRVTGGITTTEDSDGPDEDVEFDEGYLLSLGLGHRLGARETGLGFALELDGFWSDQDADDEGVLQAVTDVTAAGVLANGVVDYRLADQFTLYGAAGIGAAWLDIGTASDGINEFDDEDGPFLAWQLKAGVAWNFGENTALHLGYRFLNIDDAEIDDGIGDADFDLQTQQHVLELGLLFGI